MKTINKASKIDVSAGANSKVFPKKPNINHAGGSKIYCEKGGSYTDLAFTSFYNILGHNSKVLHKVQSSIIQTCSHHSFSIEDEPYKKMQEQISNFLPNGIHPVFVTSHESLAIDMAIKTAYLYWKEKHENQRKTIVSFAHSYHGPSFSCIGSNSSYKHFDNFTDLATPFEHIPFPKTWVNDPLVDKKELLAYQRIENYLQEQNQYVCAVILEPLVQSVSGLNICRPSFLNKVYKLIKSYNIPIIADERFTSGFRCGEKLSSNLLDITPDIIVMGQTLVNSITNFGVTSVKGEILNTLNSYLSKNSFLFTHGFQASPFALTCLNATLEELISADTQKNISKIFQTHQHRIPTLNKKPIVENPRYLGTIAAFDLVCEKHNKHQDLCKWFQNACMQENLLIHCKNKTVFIIPPYCLTATELHSIYDQIECILQNIPLEYITIS